MAKAVTLNQIRNVPYALALAFACAWMLDPSAAIPAGFASLISFSQYPHLLVTSLAFGILALFHRQTSVLLSSKTFVVASCSLCFLGFFGAWIFSLQPETSWGVLPFACLCVTALCQASLLISCLKALAGLPLVNCLLTVSYTHLDVYKRQVPQLSFGGGSAQRPYCRRVPRPSAARGAAQSR